MWDSPVLLVNNLIDKNHNISNSDFTIIVHVTFDIGFCRVIGIDRIIGIDNFSPSKGEFDRLCLGDIP